VLRDRLAFADSAPLLDPREAAAASVGALIRERGVSQSELSLRRTSFEDWALLVPEPRGALSFKRFPFQRSLYSEEVTGAREVVVMKAAQCGLSAWAIRLALYSADVLGWTALYTFPTEKELQRFSSRRLRSAIRGSEHLMSRMPAAAVDSVFQKQVGPGWVELRGTNKPVDYLDADIAIFDEYESSNAENIATAEQRVTGPDSAGLLRRLGVPAYPGSGIAAAFEASDARVWNVKCDSCGHWNPLRGLAAFEANVDIDRAEVVCADCRTQLDVRAGEWVATYPDRDVIGFCVPKLLIPDLDLPRLIKKSRLTAPYEREMFMNRDLGEAYVSAENRLGVDAVRECVDRELRPLPALQSDKFVGMGIDVANARPLNVVIGEWLGDGRTRRVFVGQVEGHEGRSVLEMLGDLMRAYGVTMAVIDNEPDGWLSRTFAANHPGRVYRGDYFNPGAGARWESRGQNVDDDAGFISLWRSRWIDAALQQFREGRVLLPPLDLLPSDYPAHLGSLVREVTELPNGTTRIQHIRTGADDYAHCEVFLLAAFFLLWRRVGQQRIAELEATPVPLLSPVADLSSYGGPGVYRPGFESEDEGNPWSYG
jgi:hypothetical protein